MIPIIYHYLYGRMTLDYGLVLSREWRLDYQRNQWNMYSIESIRNPPVRFDLELRFEAEVKNTCVSYAGMMRVGSRRRSLGRVNFWGNWNTRIIPVKGKQGSFIFALPILQSSFPQQSIRDFIFRNSVSFANAMPAQNFIGTVSALRHHSLHHSIPLFSGKTTFVARLLCCLTAGNEGSISIASITGLGMVSVILSHETTDLASLFGSSAAFLERSVGIASIGCDVMVVMGVVCGYNAAFMASCFGGLGACSEGAIGVAAFSGENLGRLTLDQGIRGRTRTVLEVVMMELCLNETCRFIDLSAESLSSSFYEFDYGRKERDVECLSEAILIYFISLPSPTRQLSIQSSVRKKMFAYDVTNQARTRIIVMVVS